MEIAEGGEGVMAACSGDPLSCWELVVGKEVRLLVGLSGGGGSWSLGESGVGTWAGLGVGLNSRCG